MNPAALDAILIRLCNNRDEAALQELSHRYGQTAFGFLCGIYGHEAEKKRMLLIDAFIQTLQICASGKSSQGFLIILMKTLYEKIGRDNPKDQTMPSSENKNLRSRWALEVLGRIPWRNRFLLLLRYQMDFLFEEMSFVFSDTAINIRKDFEKSVKMFEIALAENMKARYDQLPRH